MPDRDWERWGYSMEPTVTIALISLAGICVSAVIGPLIVNHSSAKREEKREERHNKELEERKKEEAIKAKRDAEWQLKVEQMVDPIGKQVNQIEQRMNESEEKQDRIEQMLLRNEDATILSLRVDMKAIRDRVVDNNLVPDQGEKITWKELYKTYYKHGGNHFKEAVDEWGKDMGFSSEELKDFKEEAQNELTNNKKGN